MFPDLMRARESSFVEVEFAASDLSHLTRRRSDPYPKQGSVRRRPLMVFDRYGFTTGSIKTCGFLARSRHEHEESRQAVIEP